MGGTASSSSVQMVVKWAAYGQCRVLSRARRELRRYGWCS